MTHKVMELDARIRLLSEHNAKGALLMLAAVMPEPVGDALDAIEKHDADRSRQLGLEK